MILLSKKKNTGDLKAYSIVSSFGLQMIITIGIGMFAGYYLDKYLNTTPLFIIIFVFLGVGAGFRNLYVMMVKLEKEEEKDDQGN